jgi:hypothetical protein
LVCMGEIFLWIGLLDGDWRFVSGCFRILSMSSIV